MSTTNGVRAKLNQRSRTLVHGAERAGARAMLKAVGYSDDDLAKPLIGVANTWTEIGPCNFSPAQAGGRCQTRDPRGRRHPLRIQHDQHLRWHHHGHRGHEGLVDQPRSHRRQH